MSEVAVQILSPERIASAVLKELNDRKPEDAAALFAAGFRYKDHGIGLEFSHKERLAEFFQKTRELYPDYSLRSCNHAMDASGHTHRALFRRTHQKYSYFDRGCFDLAY